MKSVFLVQGTRVGRYTYDAKQIIIKTNGNNTEVVRMIKSKKHSSCIGVVYPARHFEN